MGSSRGSNFGALLTRDTLGPIRLKVADETKDQNGSESSLEPSSSHSSIRELSQAEERGLRSSFREQPYVHMDEEETDNEAKHKVKVKQVPVSTVTGDRATYTPDPFANGGTRVLFSNGGMRSINAPHLQENYDSKHFALAKSMRSGIRQHESETDIAADAKEIADQFESESTRRKMNTEQEKVSLAPKVAAFCLVVVIFVAGLVLLVYFKKEDKPEDHRGKILIEESEDEEEEQKDIYICPEVMVNLRDVMHFNCSLKMAKIDVRHLYHIFVTPPPYFNKGNPFILNVHPEEQKTIWSAYLDVHQNYYIVRVRGPEATCTSDGTFQLEFRNKRNSTIFDTSVHISVKSEVLRVNVSLTQETMNNGTDFTLGCSTRSGCQPSFVDFFAEINREEQLLRGVDFSCIIKYNDYDGYSVSCVGNIPDFLMSQFERITCRPRSSLLDDLKEEELEELEVEIELPECDLTKHCGYKCVDKRDYYVVSRERCDIFHRCYEKRVFTSYCAPGTFFDPNVGFCTCRHITDLPWCQKNGALKPGSDATNKLCFSRS